MRAREAIKGKTAICRVSTEPKGKEHSMYMGIGQSMCVCVCICSQAKNISAEPSKWGIVLCVLAAYKSIDSGPAATPSPGRK